MTRRLYFLVPDESQAARLVADIEGAGVERRHIHAITGKGRTLTRLPPATVRQQHDMVWRAEHWLWNANLGLFGLAVLGLVVSLYWGFSVWSVTAIAVMLFAVAAGVLFALFVPDTHLDEFRGALAHGDILVMVDVPKDRVAAIEKLVYRRHPEVMAGGVGWTIEALGI